MGVYKPLCMTGKKFQFMGVTRDLAPGLIRQFLHSNWSRATAEGFTISKLEGCCVERNHLTIIIFVFILLFDQKVVMFLTEKAIMNGNQSVLNRFSTSGLNPPRPGS